MAVKHDFIWNNLTLVRLDQMMSSHDEHFCSLLTRLCGRGRSSEAFCELNIQTHVNVEVELQPPFTIRAWHIVGLGAAVRPLCQWLRRHGNRL